jgi:hypothetical protein
MRREDDVLVTVAEAAGILGVDPATVWRYIKAEDLTPARAQKPYMLWQSDVVKFAEQPRKKPGPKPGKKRRRTVDYRQARPRIFHCAAEAPADYATHPSPAGGATSG